MAFEPHFRTTVSEASFSSDRSGVDSALTSPRGSPTKSAGLVGLRSIPGRIRALAKAIHDDTQFDELRHPTTNAFRMPAAIEILSDLGVVLTDEELMLFDVAVTEYAQQLQGVNPFLVKREAVSSVLTLTASIDAEAAFAGVSVPVAMDAVVSTHGTFMQYINVVLPLSGVAPFSAFSDAATRELKVLDEATKSIAARRGKRFRPSEVPKVRRANGRLWHIVAELQLLVPALLQTVLFDVHDVVTDLAAQETWDAVAGRSVPVISRVKAALLFKGCPDSIAEALVKLMDPFGTEFVTVYAFANVVHIWGPFVLMAQNAYRDLMTGAFALYAVQEEAELHLTGIVPLFEPFDCGDRRRWGDAVFVVGSRAQLSAQSEAEEQMKPTAGNFCITLSRERGHLLIQVLDRTLNVREYDLCRDRGAWNVKGLSREHFETIHDAVDAYGAGVLLHAVGHDCHVAWHKGETVPLDTACHALHRACYSNNLAFVQHLLTMGNDVVVNVSMADNVLIPGDFMWTPLFFAVNSPCGDPRRIVQVLLDTGADVNVVDEAGCTVLYYAIVNGYTESVKLLLEANPGLGSSDTTDRMLMALGAHHFIVNDNDVQRLSQAKMYPDVVETLLKHEDDMDFVLLLWAIVDGKIRGEALRPEDDLDKASKQPRLSHLRSRTIVTTAQQDLVDSFIRDHSARSRRDATARRCLNVIQHKVFSLSVVGHVKQLHAEGRIREHLNPDDEALNEDGISYRMASSGYATASLRAEMAALGLASPTASARRSSNAGSAVSGVLTPPSTTSPQLPRRSPEAGLTSPTWPAGGDDVSFVASGSVNAPALPAARRRSSLAFVTRDEGVLLTPRELVEYRKRYSVTSLVSPGSGLRPPRSQRNDSISASGTFSSSTATGILSASAATDHDRETPRLVVDKPDAA